MKIIKTIVSTIISILCLQVAFADRPDWVDNPAGFAYTASLSAALVSNNGVLVTGTDECGYCCDVAGCNPEACCANGISGTNDILAAFGKKYTCTGADVDGNGADDPQPTDKTTCLDPAGDGTGTAGTWAASDENEVRGIANNIIAVAGPSFGEIIHSMEIRSNDVNDLITFQYYDASEDKILIVDETYTFEINGLIGSQIDVQAWNASPKVVGCMESGAINYNSGANVASCCDHSCVDGSLPGGPDCASAFSMGASCENGLWAWSGADVQAACPETCGCADCCDIDADGICDSDMDGDGNPDDSCVGLDGDGDPSNDVDACGECNGNNPTDCFADGSDCVSNNQCQADSCDGCGICGGSDYFTNGSLPNGNCDCFGNTIDVCDVCGGDGSACCNNACDPSSELPDCDGAGNCVCNLGLDCDGICGGPKQIDVCGDCIDPSDTFNFGVNFVVDCACPAGMDGFGSYPEPDYLTLENLCVPREFSNAVGTTQKANYYPSSIDIDGGNLNIAVEDWVAAYRCLDWNGAGTECINLGKCVGARKWDTSACNSGVCEVPAFGQESQQPVTDDVCIFYAYTGLAACEGDDGTWDDNTIEAELFTDCNGDLSICENDATWDSSMGNGWWDTGEDFVDTNGNGSYDNLTTEVCSFNDYTQTACEAADGGTWSDGYMQDTNIPIFRIFDTSENTYYEANSSGAVTTTDGSCSGTAPDCMEWMHQIHYEINELDVSNDCNGDLGGTAYMDDCGYCVGGNTDCTGLVDADGNSGVAPCVANWKNLGCGCDKPAALTYCQDPDEDGLGNGEAGIEYCLEDIPNNTSPVLPATGWVNNCDEDMGEWNCPTNNTDACGVCGGDNPIYCHADDEACTENNECQADYCDACGVCAGNNPIYCYADDEACTENNECQADSCDECGICGGDNSTCLDCAGVPNGDATLDECAGCSSGVWDCAGVCDGTAVEDCAGNCSMTEDVSNLSYLPNDISNNYNYTCTVGGLLGCDCNDVCGGTTAVDACGECAGNNPISCFPNDSVCVSNNECQADSCDDCGICGGDNSTCLDCAGVSNGGATVDHCDVCDNDPSNDCIRDCANVWGGTAAVDECDVCGGNNYYTDGLLPNGACNCAGNTLDCAGVCGGTSIYDECFDYWYAQGQPEVSCGDGGTGIEDGKCNCAGDVEDCAGTCAGTAEELEFFYDADGDGYGGPTSAVICNYFTDSSWIEFQDDINDNCNCSSNDVNICEDCAGVCGGAAFNENYCEDIDGDGLGYGAEKSYCNASIPAGYVSASYCNDPDPDCPNPDAYTSGYDLCYDEDDPTTWESSCGGDNSDCDGCIDPIAENYDQYATVSKAGACIYPEYGCTETAALNYWCNIPTNASQCSFNNLPSHVYEDGSCDYPAEVGFSFGQFDIPTKTMEIYINNDKDLDFITFTIEGATVVSAEGGLVETEGLVPSISGDKFTAQNGLLPDGSGILTTLVFSSYEEYICFKSNASATAPGYTQYYEQPNISLGGCSKQLVPGEADAAADLSGNSITIGEGDYLGEPTSIAVGAVTEELSDAVNNADGFGVEELVAYTPFDLQFEDEVEIAISFSGGALSRGALSRGSSDDSCVGLDVGTSCGEWKLCFLANADVDEWTIIPGSSCDASSGACTADVLTFGIYAPCQASCDCNLDCGGNAFYDDCGDCVGGGTNCMGETNGEDISGSYPCASNWKKDACGLCDGPGYIEWYIDGDEDDLGYSNTDTDGDGAPNGTPFCSDIVPTGYVPNNDDDEPNCKTNDTDLCGDCGGSCNNEPLSGGYPAGEDACGNLDCAGECVAIGSNLDDNGQDCIGICGGLNQTDICGTCDADITNDCIQDCSGECDISGVCNGGSNHGNACSDDASCPGLYGGVAELDGCQVCSGGTSGHVENIDKDCANECFGFAYNDNCSICSDGNSGNVPNETQDCTGFCGTAGAGLLNEGVEECTNPIYTTVGTCEVSNYWGQFGNDVCDVCEGDGTSCLDCNGEANGTAVYDNCGLECIAANDPSDDCSIHCDSSPYNDCVQDCAGQWGGDAILKTYYKDMDEDGKGAQGSNGHTLCNGLSLFQWADNDDDIDDDCLSNIHDCAGVCDGPLLDSNSGNTTSDGVGTDECGVCNGSGAIYDCGCTGIPDEACDCLGTTIPVGKCDCDGNTLDCAGVCGGDATLDECAGCSSGDWDCAGVCNGTAVVDCAGVCNGTTDIDECGVCGGSGIPVSDCDCAGNTIDDCGVCGGPGIPVDDCNCAGNTLDCAGVCGGDALKDQCNICDNDPSNDCAQDCAGIWGGSAVADCEGVCGNYSDGSCHAESRDCKGECCGTSLVDACDVCAGNGTSCLDCNGEANGPATLDNCNVCDNDPSNDCVYDCQQNVTCTSQTEFWNDGQCWGGMNVVDNCYTNQASAAQQAQHCLEEVAIDGSSLACIQDCNGIWGGDYENDGCGVCRDPEDLDWNKSCSGCTISTACNYDPNALYYSSCEYPVNNSDPVNTPAEYDCDGNCIFDLDCMGICDGPMMDIYRYADSQQTSFYGNGNDECEVCGGEGANQDFYFDFDGDGLGDPDDGSYYCSQPVDGFGEPLTEYVPNANDEYPQCESNVVDCEGTCSGTAEYDCAGECGGYADFDCMNICRYEDERFEYDNCGLECIANHPLAENDPLGECAQHCRDDVSEHGFSTDCNEDCLGVLNGGALIDVCEVCNGDNTSCDEGCGPNQPAPETWYFDGDGDGFGIDSNQNEVACSPPNQYYVNNSNDVDDTCETNIRDCAGECNGDLLDENSGVVSFDGLGTDDCGQCGENIYFDESGFLLDGSCDCNSVVGSDTTGDGIIDDYTVSEFDCLGVCDGGAEHDACGICNGPGYAIGFCDCDKTIEQKIYCEDKDPLLPGEVGPIGDGLGAPGSEQSFCEADLPEGWVEDCTDPDPNCRYDDVEDCGHCGCSQCDEGFDCRGDCGGELLGTGVFECSSGPENNKEDCIAAGKKWGQFGTDECGVCNGPSSCIDCSGIVNGDAFLNACGDCECGINGTELAVTDACDLPDYKLYLSNDGSVLYNSSVDIAGFQFNVDGATTISGSGGDASAVGMNIGTVSTGNMLIATSFTMSTFSGCGIMVEIDITGEATGLSNIIVSDPTGNPLPFEYYNSDCIDDDEYECVYDCSGTLNGTRKLDECGVCGEPVCTVPGPPKANYTEASNPCDVGEYPSHPNWNASCTDCYGNINGPGFMDVCGYCVEENISTGDFNLPCNLNCQGQIIDWEIGENYYYSDRCGICNNNPDDDCIIDCEGDWGGNAALDGCGICDGLNALQDCGGVCGGDAKLDNCGICECGSYGTHGGQSTCIENSDCGLDCSNEWGGTAEESTFYYDGDGDGKGNKNVYYIFCDAFMEDACPGNGVSGWCFHDEGDDFDMDDEVFCVSNYIDCAGDCDGTAFYDEDSEECCIDTNGSVTCEGLALIEEGLIPEEYSIHNIYPNPFNPSANIIYTLPENAHVKVTVYDLRGAEIKVLKNGFEMAGYYSIQWNASAYASGVYFIEMRSDSFREVRKVLYMK